MRKRYLLVLAVPAVALLALGAVPALIGGGDVHYVVATEVDLEDGVPEGTATETINASNLSENRFPYTAAALEAGDGVSGGYEEGRFGFEGAFTHTPFDEFSEFEVWNPDAVDGDVVWLSDGSDHYRLEITEDPDDVGGEEGTGSAG